MYKEKCEDCRAWAGRFHLCTKDASTEVVWDKPKKPRVTSEETREKMSAAAKKRWAATSEEWGKKRTKVVKLYSRGMTMHDISEELEVSHGFVVQALHQAQKDGIITVRNQGGVKRVKVTPNLLKRVCDLYTIDKLSIDSVSFETGLSRWTVRKILQKEQEKRNLTIRPASPQPKPKYYADVYKN